MADARISPKSYLSAWLLLLAGLLATGYVAYITRVGVESDLQRQFASDANEIEFRIEKRLQAHKLVLLGGAALFDASAGVSRDGWRAYAERVEIDQHFQGIQGLGFSLLIPKNQLPQHIAEIRSQGFPEYTVLPAGERDPYSSIIYLEPFEGRNLRAFGYDMYSEPVRRAAMEQARDENVAALTGKVELVQETGEDVQAGTLMYVPVYRKSMPLETVEQRRAALYGWAYSPFRMDDLLLGILEGWSDTRHRHLSLRVYDGRQSNADSLLYSSRTNRDATSPGMALFSLERHINFNGREWTLHFEQLEGSVSGADYSKMWMALAGGLGLSFLSFLLMLSYLNTQRNAARIAGELTVELRKVSGYARSLIEASLDPLVTISAEGKITDVNHATEQVTGRSRIELVGTDFSDYFTEPDQAKAGYRKVFSEGRVTDYPLSIRHSNGSITDVLYNASIYRDEAGKILGVFAAARDITERKLAEDALREKEERLVLATVNNGVGVWDWNLQTQEMIWDDSMYALYHIRRKDFSGTEEAWRAALHPDDLARGDKEVEDAIAGIKPFDTEFRVIWPNGEVRYIKAVAKVFRDDRGTPLRMLGINMDVTDRRQAEMELRELNNEFVTLLENTSDFIYFKDQGSRIRFCSQAMADITGHKSWRDMIGKHDFEIFPADTARIYYEEELPIFREGKALLNKTDPYYDEQGKRGWVNTNKWPVFGDDKKTVVGIFGISRDITELKEAENKVSELNRELEQRVAARTAELEAANHELEAFSYSVSHDLRTPLRAIDGFSRILLEDYESKLDDEGKRLLKVVRDNTGRMAQLIDDILHFSRAGRTEISSVEIDMEGLTRTVIEELKPLVGGRKLQINLGRLPKMQGDRTLMHQVLENLLTNAIKFTGHKEDAHIDIGGGIEDGKAVYYVRDDGDGFDMQYAGKLFGVFQRLHRVDEFDGTGIGLAIAKRIIARHGGTIWAEGEVGKGATFYFSIPLSPGQSA